jgi:hypothetical protein
LLDDQSGLVLGDSTVFFWAGCHIEAVAPAKGRRREEGKEGKKKEKKKRKKENREKEKKKGIENEKSSEN